MNLQKAVSPKHFFLVIWNGEDNGPFADREHMKMFYTESGPSRSVLPTRIESRSPGFQVKVFHITHCNEGGRKCHQVVADLW